MNMQQLHLERTAASGPANRAFQQEASNWSQVLRRAGICPTTEQDLLDAAERHGTSFHSELLISEHIDHKRYFRTIAERLGLPYCDRLDSSRLIMRNRDILTALSAQHGPRIVHYASSGARTKVLISPSRFDLTQMSAYLQRYPDLASRMMVVEPKALRRALLERARPLLSARAQRELVMRHPGYSASTVASGRQGFIIGALAVTAVMLAVLAPAMTILVVHWLAVFFFLACVVLRLMAACRPMHRKRFQARNLDARALPTYSVLVALYREAEVADQLVKALSRLDWPPSKLEIKLVCEADDSTTLAALEETRLPPNFEIIVVPPAGPRTKPKALAFALPTITGDFVVVYDAEDLPHPMQLREAWETFENSPPDLACVQAPLTIANAPVNMLTRMFAFEYAALFRGLLPALAAWNAYLPLGGTSNHFRVGILRKVGGWDPFNVTEDADLALRLCRHGYRIGTISLPTYEDAPDRLKPWFHQRSRWFKGWMQTLLVHWRSPIQLCRQLPPASLASAHILLLGICFSSLSYLFLPFVLVMMIGKFLLLGELNLASKVLLALDVASISLAFFAFALLGWRATAGQTGRSIMDIALCLPVYWMLLSAASWHALYKVITDPFHWAKTPHRRSVLKTE